MLLQLKIDQVCKTDTGLTVYYTLNDDNSIDLIHVKQENKVVKLAQEYCDLIVAIIEKHVTK